MQDQTEKFICLAEYWCPCHPVGKPVSERTMDRHRKLINDRRASLGLSRLPRGPRHSVEKETHQYDRRASLNVTMNPFSSHFRLEVLLNIQSVQNPDDAVNNAIATVSVDTDIAAAECVEQTPMENVTAGGNDWLTSTENVSPHSILEETDASSAIDSEEDVVQPTDSFNTDEVVPAAGNDANTLSSIPGNGTAFGEGDNESENVTDNAKGQDMRSHALIRFQSWAHAEKEWVETFIEYGVTDRLMGRILKLRKAPLVPITLRRNLIKYSGFETALFQTCLGHMLIGELSDDHEYNGVASDQRCDVCSEKNTSPRFSIFEYIKLLPRLKSWVAHEESCRLLFEYRHEQIRERSETGSGLGPDIFYSDIVDGILFRRIADENGGLSGMEYDITLAVSCDGFQTFSNNSYDCWPIVALNHNLPPSIRFLIHNLVPLGFIKGPKEPVRLDTFLTPLLEEVNMINENGGTSMMFFDGVERTLRVHIVFVTGDSPAVAKLAGTTGSNGKTSCRLCEHQGVYCPTSRHYYFPSKVLVASEGSVRRNWKILYDIHNLDMRSCESVQETLNILEDGQTRSRSQRERIQRETGVKKRTITLRFPSIFAYESFPLDTMHLIMNVSKDLMELLRGENRITNRATSESEEFVLSQSSLHAIDSEISTIGGGTASYVFGNAPRSTSDYKSWKAVECKDFFRWYAVILFEGHLSSVVLGGIRTFGAIIERCTWPSISQADVDDLKRLCCEFVRHFEDRYFKYNVERMSICKSTIHALLHLGRTIELCGPLVNVNQFWVERYIGAVKQRLHAKRLAAEALTENAKVMEAYKM